MINKINKIIEIKTDCGLFLVHRNKLNLFNKEWEITEELSPKTMLFQVWNKRINKTGNIHIKKRFSLSDCIKMII